MNHKQKAEEILKLPDNEQARTLFAIKDDRDFILVARRCLHSWPRGQSTIKTDPCIKDRARNIRKSMSNEQYANWVEKGGK